MTEAPALPTGDQRSPGWTAPSRAETRYRALLRVVRGLLHLCTRRRTTAAELLPATGPVIVVGNHLSVADAFVLATAVARCRRRIRMLGTAGLFRAPVVGGLLRAAGFIPVHRWSPDPASALAPARAALAAGQCIGLYPEGAITRHPDLWPARGKTGVVRLALDTGAPVVPIAQWGTQRFVGPEGTRWRALLSPLLRPRIDVRFGAPIDLRALLGAGSAAEATPAQLREGADAVMAALVAELAVLRGEAPPPHAGRAPNPPKPRRRR
ncbi:MAG TPA: lysophospholipid acyltransferase family protein [Mycobacteriales bacterium]|nr:lysophospholipid acyltransferase family protein [Mycobacteriales bacterium]